VRIGVIVSDLFHFQAGAKPQSALVKLGSKGAFEYLGLCGATGPEVLDYLSEGEGRFVQWQTLGDLTRTVRAQGVDVLFCDDYLPRLRVARVVSERVRIPLVAYVQVFRGLRSLNTRIATFDSTASRFVARTAHLLPFSVTTLAYRKLLRRADCIVGNSLFARSLLQTLYGLPSDMVAYPPTAPTFHRDELLLRTRDQGRFVMYFGNPGEHDRDHAARIAIRCNALGLSRCDAFGDVENLDSFERFFQGECVPHSRLSDLELSDLYARAEVTIVPQWWENFGVVGPESLLAGTPVLLNSYQPWLEITGPGDFVRYLEEGVSPRVNSLHYTDNVGDFVGARRRLKAALAPQTFADTIAKAATLALNRFAARAKSSR
jgi:glycosyltransferase involved in cell wall biosynthesis